jgi:hypothetical protein
VDDSDLDCFSPFPLLFIEDFESGVLGPQWNTNSTGVGRIHVTAANSPCDGGYHLTMDDSRNGRSSSLNELVLTIDLSGQTGVTLGFDHKEFDDQDHTMPAVFNGSSNSDGVAISADGQTWYKVQGLTSTDGISSACKTFMVDLDAAIAAAGIGYNSTFKLKFQQYDKHSIPNNGFAFDYIALYSQPQTSETDCTDGIDNDGDGQTDCADSDCAGSTRPTSCGAGECAGNTGIETCAAGTWGGDTCDPFEGAITEVCDDNADNDCDGAVDTADTDCQECVPNATQACDTGLPRMQRRHVIRDCREYVEQERRRVEQTGSGGRVIRMCSRQQRCVMVWIIIVMGQSMKVVSVSQVQWMYESLRVLTMQRRNYQGV